MRLLTCSLVCCLLAAPALAETDSERPATVLLITSEQLAAAWAPFVAWKTGHGKPTQLLTVKAIGERYEGADIQAKIRAAVLEHVAKRGTRYVILGGDSTGSAGHVPHRVTAHRMLARGRAPRFPGNCIKPGDHEMPTDVYYISEKSWDANGNGVYGEWPADKAEISYHHSEGVAIGRIPVRTAAQVAAYTEKVVGYESAYPTDAFATRFMYTNTVRHSQPKVVKSWDAHISKAWGGEVLRFFHQSTPWDQGGPGSHALNVANWRQKLNGKLASKLHMHGHGMPSFWVLEHATGNTMITAEEVAKLSNENAYPIITTVSCFTGQFDTDGDPCIAEIMLRAPKKGAIIMIAPSRPGVPVFHNPRVDFRLMVTQGKLDGTTESMTRFWVNGLKQHDGKYLSAGHAFAKMKEQMTAHAVRSAGYHMVQCELNLLGDPTLDMRAQAPKTPALEAPAGLKTGSQSITIKTAPGLTVCLSKGAEVYAITTADAEGNATLTIAPRSAGELLVTASGANHNHVKRVVTISAR